MTEQPPGRHRADLPADDSPVDEQHEHVDEQHEHADEQHEHADQQHDHEQHDDDVPPNEEQPESGVTSPELEHLQQTIDEARDAAQAALGDQRNDI